MQYKLVEKQSVVQKGQLGVFADENILPDTIIMTLEGTTQPFSPFSLSEKQFRISIADVFIPTGLGANINDNVDYRQLTYDETAQFFTKKVIPRMEVPHNCVLEIDSTIKIKSTGELIQSGSELVLDYGTHNWVSRFISDRLIDYSFQVDYAKV